MKKGAPKKWYSLITVEPTMFLYMMAFMLTTVIEQVFFVYKACRVDHNYPEDVCRNIQNYDNVKKEVQVIANQKRRLIVISFALFPPHSMTLNRF